MKRFRSIFLLCLGLAAAVSCGKKGPLLPPLVLVPQKIETVTLFQRGEEIVLEWTNPSTTIGGTPLSAVSEVEIRSLERPKPQPGAITSVTPAEFEKESQLAISLKLNDAASQKKSESGIPPAKKTRSKTRKKAGSDDKSKTATKLRAQIPIPMAKLNTTLFFFALRVRDERRRTSEFSAPLCWEPLALPLPPQSVAVRAFEDRLEIHWKPPAANIDRTAPAVFKGYNVYRHEGEGAPLLRNQGLVQGVQFDDKDFVEGKTYRYIVRASVSEAAPFSESADSETAEVTVKDLFPPASPSGLKAVATSGAIMLVWDANAEKDLAGYKIWRRGQGQKDFLLLTPQVVVETTTSDATVEKNRRYEYAISAVDRAGNESPKSAAVSETAKDGDR